MALKGIIDETCARLIKREVSDGIIALDYTNEALEILKEKKKGKFFLYDDPCGNRTCDSYLEGTIIPI